MERCGRSSLVAYEMSSKRFRVVLWFRMPQVLVKIGKEVHMRDLCENGTVFMRRLGAYQDLEGRVVGDPHEGLLYRATNKNPTLKVTAKVGDQSFPLEIIDLKVPCSAKDHAVYCMSAIDVPGDGTFCSDRDLVPFLEDRRLLEFGDTLIIFKNSEEFIDRIHKAARAAGHELDTEGPGPVNYVSDTYCGKVGPYTKIGDYSYQREFRFMTNEPTPDASLTLKLGSMMHNVLRLDLDEYYRTTPA